MLHNLCLQFVRQDRQDRKTGRKACNLSDKNTKNQKTKIWDEQNKYLQEKKRRHIKKSYWSSEYSAPVRA